jgi:hypothetical protein
MSYRVIQDEQGRYNIQETSTDEIIHLSRPKEQEVRDLCRKLNLGSGFNGWTPTFFSRKAS